jgi:hypothetical protein
VVAVAAQCVICAVGVAVVADRAGDLACRLVGVVLLGAGQYAGLTLQRRRAELPLKLRGQVPGP